MDTIKHKKNKKITTPYRLFNIFKNKKNQEYSFEIIFTEGCKYNFFDPNDIDEKDWSKGGGITLSLFNQHKNSIMLGWRYNDKVESLQTCLYYHETDKTAKYAENSNLPIWNIEVGDKLKVTIKLIKNGFTFRYQCKDIDEIITVNKNFKSSSRLIRELASWFGGTDPSPANFHYFKSKLKKISK